MSWEQYRSVMERYAIKIDDMATEDAYFMATHMPFSQLEVYEGGRTFLTPRIRSEDQIFEELVCNPNNEHRLVIVRGDNGTGKTHLIRYLKAKFEHSPAAVYDRNREQLVFLRRLNNSVRGVFGQLLDQNVICDPDVEAKLRKFVASSEAKDEESFKTDILYAYIAAVSNDMTGTVYKPVICQTIASYLSDSRIKERLLREGGPIARCYQVITAPSDQVLKTEPIFTEADFDDKKCNKNVFRKGDPKASDFANTILQDYDEITRLVNYMNRFTRDVVQRCADISSESTKAMFVQLRRDLKRQNKNLTLFIEDFTGFTGIDSELITVLSTEHSGQYSDLCRITAFVGITNAYYDDFRDNFTNRVTHQISVTDRSYGTAEFLTEMTGRYLNAIYCDPKVLFDWYKPTQELTEVPISGFQPPCAWETVDIDGRAVTLYPFNRKSITALYDQLKEKSPRTFLKYVIKEQLKEYFEGKQYGDEWYFPLNPGNTQMSRDQHSSAIDRLIDIPNQDRLRLKSVLALWADGTASGVKEADGIVYFGGIPQMFFQDIGLSAFTGIGDILDKSTGHTVQPTPPEKKPNPDSGEQEKKKPVNPKKIDAATKKYLLYKDDISGWFASGKDLKYHDDYRGWIQAFVFGNDKQAGAINWQDIGIPAYVASERSSKLTSFYIEGQDSGTMSKNLLIYLPRTPEGRDVLHALCEMQYAGGWDFDGAPYYQQRLITWLEKERKGIIQRVTSVSEDQAQLPVLEWCFAVQYLRARILGSPITEGSAITFIGELLKPINPKTTVKRETKEWNELISFVQNYDADFTGATDYLSKAPATTMGTIRGSAALGENVLYRTDELICAVEKLIAADWDIETELPQVIPENHMLYNSAALLKKLYPRIKVVVEAERKMADNILEQLEGYLGEMTQDNLVAAMNAIKDLLQFFERTGNWSLQAQNARYNKAPLELAKDIMASVNAITGAKGKAPVQALGYYSGNALNALSEWLRSFQEIDRVATVEAQKARNELQRMGGQVQSEQLVAAAQATMDELCDILENMEVRYAAD